MACLDQALDGARATVDVLARADGQVVERAAQIVETLPRISDCADAAALLEKVPAPDPAAAPRVAAARRALAEAEVASASGRYDEALRLAEGSLRDGQDLGYAPLVAEAQLRLGIAQGDLGRHRLAAEALIEATVAAGAAHSDVLAAKARVRQVRALAYDGHLDAAHRAARHAAALVARVGGGGREADLENSLGVLALREGHLAEAEAHDRRALQIRERTGADGFTLGTAHLHLGAAAGRAGDLATAEDEQRAAVRLYTDAVGAGHPAVFLARRDLALTVAKQGRADEALADLTALADRCRAAAPREPGRCADVAEALAIVLLGAGRAEEARGPARHALEVSLAVRGPEHQGTARLRALVAEIERAR
jgi:tetratricopeptide (TPR) repeat protein